MHELEFSRQLVARHTGVDVNAVVSCVTVGTVNLYTSVADPSALYCFEVVRYSSAFDTKAGF